MPASEKVLYLTFDDGPHPMVTNFVLDELQKFEAKASFFCIGKNVQAHPDVYHRIREEGHAIGNHSYSHLNGWNTTDEVYLEDIANAAKVIDTTLFRPPYGKIKYSQIKKLSSDPFGYKLIMWSVLSADFDKKVSDEQCLQYVLQNSKAGSIVVFHDSEKAFDRMRYALPRVLKYFHENGYRFEKLEEVP
jgi:peptidoglycan/xylan/chitin deacetylase (PgdA/CDA1 family)